jgi:uncharacterized membrane protein YkvA (DUF1232 family)
MSETYSDSSFWEKVKSKFKKIGEALLYKILLLYYAAQRPDVPVWAKTIIYGALAYLISPIDAIPDMLPGGYADDAGVIALALAQVSMYIDEDVKQKAKEKVEDWFG